MNALTSIHEAHGIQLSRVGHRILTVTRALPIQVFEKLLRWQELAAQRRALLGLDDQVLKDIGIGRGDAFREAQRPFWDDPLA